MPNNDSTFHFIAWLFPMLIGAFIVGWKTLKFKNKDKIKLVGLDIFFIFNFYIFSLLPMISGVNFIISGVIGGLLITLIDQKILSKKGVCR